LDNTQLIVLQGGTFEILENDSTQIQAKGEITYLNPYFAGHFESFAVLPGVAQVELVLDLIAHSNQSPARLKSIERSKYLEPIIPGTKLTLNIRKQENGAEWLFQSDQKVYSRGKLTYE
jgi:3-hydroxymyristoyl/3-hydroxydecanoyl-(acyl carrier protein) dehydratase